MGNGVRRAASVLGMAAMLAIGASAPTAAQPGGGWRERGPGCTVYGDADYAGPRDFARDGTDNGFVGPAWNDTISSIQCAPRCVLEGYEHANYQGLRQDFRGETRFVGPFWNDKISAFRVRCEGGGGRGGGWGGRGGARACTLYGDANYQGPREIARDGEDNPFVGERWNDQVSSIQCRPGCVLEAFQDADFRGLRQDYRGETRFVGPFWNDKLSSYRVRCGR